MSKLYLPQELINSEYTYQITPSNDRIDIKTRNNCQSNQCDCVTIYYDQHYVLSQWYRCANGSSSTSLNSQISYTDFTSNIFYRNDMPEILLMTFILLLICFYFPYKIISRLFGRWLKI